jgi:hypothetical protein
MSTHPQDSSRPADQRDFVQRIVREVIARLANPHLPSSDPSSSAPSSRDTTSRDRASAVIVAERIVTARTISGIAGTPTQIAVPPTAVITPAARDEARRRGITIETNRGKEQQVTSGDRAAPNECDGAAIRDTDNPQRAAAVTRQLAGRGIKKINARVVLSDTPALEVHRSCTQDHQRSVMIASLADVDRFANELNPTLWVIDMARMNLTMAVNIIARIQRRTPAETKS